jgi:16S rRNA U516 pseudouridylate synthase RsuA-like enzyme
LIRVQIGALELGDLVAGEWKSLEAEERARLLGATPRG